MCWIHPVSRVRLLPVLPGLCVAYNRRALFLLAAHATSRRHQDPYCTCTCPSSLPALRIRQGSAGLDHGVVCSASCSRGLQLFFFLLVGSISISLFVCGSDPLPCRNMVYRIRESSLFFSFLAGARLFVVRVTPARSCSRLFLHWLDCRVICRRAPSRRSTGTRRSGLSRGGLSCQVSVPFLRGYSKCQQYSEPEP